MGTEKNSLCQNLFTEKKLAPRSFVSMYSEPVLDTACSL